MKKNLCFYSAVSRAATAATTAGMFRFKSQCVYDSIDYLLTVLTHKQPTAFLYYDIDMMNVSTKLCIWAYHLSFMYISCLEYLLFSVLGEINIVLLLGTGH